MQRWRKLHSPLPLFVPVLALSYQISILRVLRILQAMHHKFIQITRSLYSIKNLSLCFIWVSTRLNTLLVITRFKPNNRETDYVTPLPWASLTLFWSTNVLKRKLDKHLQKTRQSGAFQGSGETWEVSKGQRSYYSLSIKMCLMIKFKFDFTLSPLIADLFGQQLIFPIFFWQ